MPISGGPLREEKNTAHHEDQERARGGKTAQGQAAMIQWFVEEITQNGAQGTGEDESRPKKECAGKSRPEKKSRHRRQKEDEQGRASQVSHPLRICRPIP